MMRRIAMLAATGALAAACASNPAPAAPGGASPVAATPSAPAATAAAVAPLLNLAATSHWVSEEKLIPDDPVLALVAANSMDADNPIGISAKCNAANGGITMRLGKQAGAKVGETATYTIRTGAQAKTVQGKFETNTKAVEPDFVFPIAASDLLAFSQLDLVSVLTDKGDVQWALVKDPSAQVSAKYIGSLKDYGTAARDFLAFCNPK